MADIVNSLFGVDPQQLMQQRQATDAANAYRFASLDPMQRAQMSIYQGGAGVGRLAGGLLGGDPELEKVSKIKQLSTQFDLTSTQGVRDFAQALQPFAPQEAMMAAQRAQQMMGTEEQTKLRAAQTAQAEAGKIIQIDAGDKIQLVNTLTNEVIREIPKGLTPSQAAKQGTTLAGGIDLKKLSPAEKVVDQKFGKEYNDFINGGGIDTVDKNLKLLDDAISIIDKSADGDISGKMVNLSDKAGTLSYTHPKAAEAKDLIGGVAQSNLRAVLGGQFAQKEGEALLARAYNPAQPKADNLNRLKALRDQIANTGKAKSNASLYYQEFGTLKGFKGISNEPKLPDNAATPKKTTTRKLKSGIEVTVEE